MTETVCAEPPSVISTEAKSVLQEKLFERKTIVYETLIDPVVIKIAAENLKEQLFTKLGFLRPPIEEVKVVAIEKTYEPFINIKGNTLSTIIENAPYHSRLKTQSLNLFLASAGSALKKLETTKENHSTGSFLISKGRTRVALSFM